MSGIELIVGAVLGGIPIVLEVYDRYSKVYNALQILRNPKPSLAVLKRSIQTQKVLFEYDIFNLRDKFAEENYIATILCLREPNWESFQARGFDGERGKVLHQLLDSWKQNLEHIDFNLQIITNEIENSRRIKLMIKQSDIKATIDDLRRNTMNFSQLTSKIVEGFTKLQDKAKPSHSCHQNIAVLDTVQHRNSLELYRRVQAASSFLYKALESKWSCTLHETHTASISFTDMSSSSSSRDFIKLDALVKPSGNEEEHLWLEVEYIETIGNGGSGVVAGLGCAKENIMDKLQKHMQDLTAQDSTEPSTKRRKMVHFDMDTLSFTGSQELDSLPSTVSTGQLAQAHLQPIPSLPATDSSRSSNPQPNLDNIPEACRSFHETPSGQSIPCSVDHPFNAGQCRLFRAAKQVPTSSQISLDDIITWYAEDDVGRYLSRASTAYLAASISSSVLQYHSTPWLPDIWRSNQVRFYGVCPSDLENNTEGFKFSSPYFEIDLSAAWARRKGKARDTTTPATQVQGSPIARNKLLFHLGIILLELGYGRPWAELEKSVSKNDISQPKSPWPDYKIAEELSRGYRLLDKMGPQYPVIIRKCLGCDFGTGESDLQNESLQGVFAVDVVCAFRDMARGLNEIHRRIHG